MNHLIRASILAVGASALFSFAATAHANDLLGAASSEITRIWEDGSRDVYLPLHTHHLRGAYDAKVVDALNERPLGVGFGKSYKNAAHGWHGLYAMAFLDSNSRIQPIAGYARIYSVARHDDWSIGLGYTAFLTARNDIANYTPVPAVLPLASIEKGNTALMATFVPGTRNKGNVLFVFGKYTWAQ